MWAAKIGLTDDGLLAGVQINLLKKPGFRPESHNL